MIAMSLKDVGAFVGKYAPMLGLALSSPVGAVAAIGSALADIFGASPSDPSDLLKKMQADPELQLKLVQFEQQHDLQCKQIIAATYARELQHEETQYSTEVADRIDARHKEEESLKSGDKNYRMNILAYCVMGGFFASLAFFFYLLNTGKSLDVAILTQVVTFVTLLGSKLNSIIDYDFGSSAGSKKKDDSITNMTSKLRGN